MKLSFCVCLSGMGAYGYLKHCPLVSNGVPKCLTLKGEERKGVNLEEVESLLREGKAPFQSEMRFRSGSR